MITWRPSTVHLPVRPFTPLNDFSTETSDPNFFKLHVEPFVKGRLKICTNGHGLLIRPLQCPYMESHLKFFFSRTKKALRLNLGVWQMLFPKSESGKLLTVIDMGG